MPFFTDRFGNRVEDDDVEVVLELQRQDEEAAEACALTEDERRAVVWAGVAASPEVARLIQIIERLTGERIPPADEKAEE